MVLGGLVALSLDWTKCIRYKIGKAFKALPTFHLTHLVQSSKADIWVNGEK